MCEYQTIEMSDLNAGQCHCTIVFDAVDVSSFIQLYAKIRKMNLKSPISSEIAPPEMMYFNLIRHDASFR